MASARETRCANSATAHRLAAYVSSINPNKQTTLNQCRYNAGPPSRTLSNNKLALDQHLVFTWLKPHIHESLMTIYDIRIINKPTNKSSIFGQDLGSDFAGWQKAGDRNGRIYDRGMNSPLWEQIL